MICILIKERRGDFLLSDKEKGCMESEAENGVRLAYSQGMPRVAGCYQKLKERPGMDSLLASTSNLPCHPSA